jgi:hypothetical protein
MPLIKCPMCEKDISPNAVSCPNCGEPMKNKKNEDSKTTLEYPSLPINLDIGKQIVNWTYDAVVNGTFEGTGMTNDIPDGKVSVLLHQYGIKITGRFYSELLRLHNSEIEGISEVSKNELTNKSVIGRAVLGGVLTGGLGAIIGGKSGIGTKNIKKYYLIVNYWDKNSKELKSLSIGCDSSSKRFIERFNNQKGN